VSRRRDRAIVAVFVVILGGGCLAQFLGLDRGGVGTEDRTLAPPEWRWDLPTYVLSMDRWFRDNFHLRREFIFANSVIKLYVLRTSASKEIALGRQGWQFFIGQRVPEYTRHTVPLDRAALEKQRREFVGRARWAAAPGSLYAVLVAPNKETIYPELLPDWLTRPVRPQSILDQISAELMRSREVRFVDVRRRLWDVKNRYVLYRRLDSHWNDLGAYHAYACLMASLAQAAQQGRHQRWARGLEPLPLGSFRIREAMEPAGFSRMMGLYSVRSENVLLEQDEERFIRRDRAPRDFDEVTTQNDHATTPLRALVFRDSFFSNMIPLVSRHFRYVRYIWGPLFDANRVVSEQPDVVITQFVERELLAKVSPPPTDPGDVDALQPAPAPASAPPCGA